MNIAGEALKDALNTTSADFDAGVDEFAVAGLTPAACTNIKAPRVAEAPVSIECKLNKIVGFGPADGPPCINRVVFGEVVGLHIGEHILRDGKVATDLLRPLARLGYRDYCTVTDTFEMIRPDAEDMISRTTS